MLMQTGLKNKDTIGKQRAKAETLRGAQNSTQRKRLLLFNGTSSSLSIFTWKLFMVFVHMDHSSDLL